MASFVIPYWSPSRMDSDSSKRKGFEIANCCYFLSPLLQLEVRQPELLRQVVLLQIIRQQGSSAGGSPARGCSSAGGAVG
ncbi:MAG: hypothetical protein WA941_16450, partial [Nitrososphaeraceae archaeon]